MDYDEELAECDRAMLEWLERSMQISFRSHSMYFKEQGFSHSQISTLHMLHHRKECAVNDVSRIHSISKPAASQLLDQLVKRNLVERHECSEDRRVKYHRLTGEGEQMIKQSFGARNGWYRSLLEELSADELDKVKEALDILNNKIKIYKTEHEHEHEHRHGFGHGHCRKGADT